MADSDPITITRFSTDDFAPKDRHEAWTNRHWPAIGVLFRSTPIGEFSNHSSQFALGNLTVHCSTITAQRYERTNADVRRDDFDHLLIPITITGEQHGEAGGRSLTCERGGLCFADLAQPETHVSSASRTIMLTLPRNVAEENDLRARDLHGVTANAAATALLRRHVSDVCRISPTLTLGQAAMLERVTTDLIGVTLALAGVGRPVSGHARDTAQLAAARALIADSLGSPTLTVTWLSRRMRVSRSTLYRLFEDEGGVLAYIRRQRLMRVRDGLTLPSGRLRIADLADRWGFSDAAHLSRQFRREFGMSPSDFRDGLGTN